MADNPRNPETATNQLISKLGSDKKKTIVAVGLVAMMAFMWVRMFVGKKPKSAIATVNSQELMSQQDSRPSEMTFVELPYSKGRHDVLTRDFFAVGKGLDSDSKNSEFSVEEGHEYLKGITNKLKLEAISFSENPQAFINGKLLSNKDKFNIKSGVNSYECEITKIEKNRVVVKCGEAEIVLKLLQLPDVMN